MANANTNREVLLELAHRSLDGDLSAADALQLSQALAANEWLRDELERLEELRALFETLHPAANPDFAEQLSARIEEESFVLRPLLRYWPAVAAAACIVLLFGLGFIYGSSGSLETEAILGLEQMELSDVYAFEY